MRNKIAFLTCAAIAASCIVYAQHAWPNLSTVKDPGFPKGSCTMNGNGAPGSAKALSNSNKNRFKLPTSYQNYKWADFIKLPSGSQLTKEKQAKLEATGVSIVGYVVDAKASGTKGESCNCGGTAKSVLDTHIDLTIDPNDPKESSRHVIVETTIRTRLLAAAGLLKANFKNPKDWSHNQLRAVLKGRWVRFKGWLFYDPDHETGAWSSDPSDQRGETNWRATPWEVHPVMEIEVLPGKPSGM